jgi:hypothetical protein
VIISTRTALMAPLPLLSSLGYCAPGVVTRT